MLTAAGHTEGSGDDVEQAKDGSQVSSSYNALAEGVSEVGSDDVVDGQLHAEAVAVGKHQNPCAVVPARHSNEWLKARPGLK